MNIFKIILINEAILNDSYFEFNINNSISLMMSLNWIDMGSPFKLIFSTEFQILYVWMQVFFENKIKFIIDEHVTMNGDETQELSKANVLPPAPVRPAPLRPAPQCPAPQCPAPEPAVPIEPADDEANQQQETMEQNDVSTSFISL